MIASLALAALLPLLATAVPCVQFDTQWNLYAFGGSQDVNLGKSSSWAQPQVTPLTSTGRPPWTGNTTQCLLSQFNNAMYVVGADASDASKIYIYSFAGNSWSTQSTSSAPSPQTRSASVLDHDTNVLFTYANGGLSQLDMSAVTTAASGSALAWEGVSAPSWGSGYASSATAAQASNHIMYFGAPNTAAGSAQIFVVHYAYWQPTAQNFASRSGGQAFPDLAGQAVSFPVDGEGVPTQLVYIPSDFSASYVVNHWTNPSSYASTDGSPYASNLINTTTTLPAPPTKDANAAYAASYQSLVQITTGGEINYIANAVGSGSATSGASWTKMNYALAGVSGGSSASASASGSATGSASSGSASASGTGSRSASASGTASASGSGAAAASSSRAAAGKVVQGGMGLVGIAGAAVVAAVAGVGMLL
ncbi:uncharacterized protein MKK02DRAFT_40655 [Dioszegia hungarica]|uniref:Fucose-specific lectin n=1 Tax=Dioszegia hungarica TaxID=4972 RepID=A0AA38LSA9_9TREE|nr:uncharacterized protein MKK02DRAFT_40655 [Dioszegia hungarica]KAI9632354.1 hypothetical protein MKK02DRAFT_40655 [Dioszegia hungarica]